jgi:arylsulfatase A-like enzyme
MRTIVLLGLAAAALISASLNSPAAQEASKRPNIVFLFSDDQRADTIAALGNAHIRTPNLDELTRRGTSCTRAYCMGALQGAVCVPSRAMLMTGRTLFRVNTSIEGQPTWPESFALVGYRTFITGKWHNGPQSLLRCFGEGKAVFLGGMGQPYDLPVEDVSPQHQLTNKRPSGKHSVELFTDCAIDFLKNQNSERPFLLYVAFNAPHDPRIAPPEYHARYADRLPPVPPNYLPQHPFNNGDLTGRDERLAPWPRTEAIVRKHLADYYASIEFLDAQVGRIVAALGEVGLVENTIIVYSSDHGLAIGSHGLFGKQNLYDHSMHAPLIFAGPGIPRGKRSDALCYLLDIFPTLGELAKVRSPEGSEGMSLVPVFMGKKAALRDALFTAYTKVQRAVRDDRWKVIAYPQVNKVQLFDLQDDPHEIKDLANDPAFASQRDRMLEVLRQAQAEAADHQALTSDKPQPLEFDFTKVK